MKIKDFKKIKDFSLIIIPAIDGSQRKNFALNFWRLAALFSLAALLIGVIAFLLFSITPLKYFIISTDVAMTEQNKKIEQLNERVIFLTRELENISALNKKLKYAIMLGDSSLFDSLENKNRSKKLSDQELPVGGNLLFIIKKLFADTTKVSIDTTRIKVRPNYFINPVNYGFITRGFNSKKGHLGIDFAVKTGTNVYATAGGFVIFADYNSDDGYMIILMHDNEYISVYKHCSALTKKIRDRVIQGEVIALSGNTGLNTTGPHLHFEIWKEGQVINPKNVLFKN